MAHTFLLIIGGMIGFFFTGEFVHTEQTVPAAVTPVWLMAPAVDIDAPVMEVGMGTDGVMEAPDTPGDIGWFEPGFVPGEPGNAVLAGHLDTASGKPAVFWRINELQTGDAIDIALSDGTILSFIVTGRSMIDGGDRERTSRLFQSSTGSYVHLVTCGGGFREDLQTYDGRLVVTARRAQTDQFAASPR